MVRFLVLFIISFYARDCWAEGPCKNDYSIEQCTKWKAKGYCTRTYVNFMKQNCAALCKFCVPIRKESSICSTKTDTDSSCIHWEKYCNKNAYVDKNCLKICCKEPSHSCSDGKWNGNEEGVDCGGSQCSPCPVVNGNWGDWSAFSKCEVKKTKTRDGLCEMEVAAPQKRTRKCDNPKPSKGGRSCGEKHTDEKPCKVCKKKCNSGKAKEEDCDSWAKQYCNDKTYMAYMKDNCAVQCGFCTAAPLPPKPLPPTQITSQGECGADMGTGRVVGGENASPGEFPWQVGIWKDGGDFYEEFFCGGTIVRPNMVITASHCVENIWTDEIKLKFGDHITKDTATQKKTKGVVTMKAELIKMHPEYNSDTVDNDIAIIKLKGNVVYSRKIQPACIPTSSDDIDWKTDGKNCWITGWGKTKGGWTDPATVLQKAKMPIISKADCKKKNSFESPTAISDNMLCAGPGPDSGVSGCQGDSGGPLVCEKPNKQGDPIWTLHGVVSWGDKLCRSKEKYTVFARVTYLRNWIWKTIREMDA